MIEVRPTTSARNGLIAGSIVLAIAHVALITAERGNLELWVLAGIPVIIVVNTVAAIVFYNRERILVDDGELRYRPAIGFERRVPLHSIERVIYAPEIIPPTGSIRSCFVVFGVDQRVFLRLSPARWETNGFVRLTEALREKGEQVPPNTLGAIRHIAPDVLTFSERHPWRFAGVLGLVMFGIIAFFYVVIVVL
jgi:hypothetical protein